MNVWLRNFILLAFMLAGSGLALALKPTHKFAAQRPTIDLQSIIPATFGEWRAEEKSTAQIVDPQQQETLDKIYNQTLTRTYVNPKGERIMLSVAYGQDQSRDLQIHRPEVCYSSRGFQIISTEKRLLSTTSGAIPAMRIVAKQGERNEPITYWVRFGDKVVRGNLEQGAARLAYGLAGYIADGILFRVSSISQTPNAAFEIQESFIDQMLKSASNDAKSYLLGKQPI